MKRGALVLLLLTAAAVAGAAEPNLLCVTNDGVIDTRRDCRVMEDWQDRTIAPAATARKFALLDAQQHLISIGVVSAGATLVDPSSAVAMICSNADAPAGEGATIVLREKRLGSWTLRVGPWWPREGRLIFGVPRGRWDLTVSSQGKVLAQMLGIPFEHAMDPRPHRLSGGLSVGSTEIVGRAVAADGSTPASFATITADCRNRVCDADAHGAFHCRIRIPTSGAICIEHPDLGRKRLELPAGMRADLGVVRLVPGGTIAVVIPPYVVLPPKTAITLIDSKGSHRDTRTIDGERVEFTGVKPGKYVVLVAGPQPLERKTFSVDVEGGEADVVVSLDAFRLSGRILLGDVPIEHASVTLQAAEWETKLETNDDGRFDAELWTPADYAVLVHSTNLDNPYAVMKQASPQESDWTIAIPKRRIAGTVIDAEGGEPVAKASVLVSSQASETHWSRRIVAREDGTFTIGGIANGSYTLRADAPGFIPAQPVELVFRSTDDDRTVELSLERGTVVHLRVIDARGEPIPNAILMTDFTADGRARRIGNSTSDGSATLTLRDGATAEVFVIARSGSFSATTVNGDSLHAPPILVPDPVGSITVTARSEEGAGLEGRAVLFRWGGRIIPRSVLNTIAELHRSSVFTDSSGSMSIPALPAGDYEVSIDGRTWTPLRLQSGEAVVSLTFGNGERHLSP